MVKGFVIYFYKGFNQNIISFYSFIGCSLEFAGYFKQFPLPANSRKSKDQMELGYLTKF
jgi:hypothetical protein